MIRPTFISSAVLSVPERLLLKGGRWQRITLRVRSGLFVHPDHGPVLIDAGYGTRATKSARRSAALKLYAAMMPFSLLPNGSPIDLLARKGFAPEQVQLIILTHLHADHICFLKDFPNARIISGDMPEADKRHGVFAELLPDDIAQRLDLVDQFPKAALPSNLGEGFDVFGDSSVLAVPLPGHTPGHFGLYFPGDCPLLYACDVQWLCKAVLELRVPRFLTNLVAKDTKTASQSVAVARDFAEAGCELMVCHDPDLTAHDIEAADV